MSIRISLLLILAVIPLFVTVELLLWLGMNEVSGMLVMLGSVMLLVAFALPPIAALLAACRAFLSAVSEFFSAKHRAERRLWFYEARQDYLSRLHYFKTARIKYVHNLERKRLLARNNRKHIRGLSEAINRELLSVKALLPESVYMQLKRANAEYSDRQDIDELLNLQRRISTD